MLIERGKKAPQELRIEESKKDGSRPSGKKKHKNKGAL
jgi:hypothetical protein